MRFSASIAAVVAAASFGTPASADALSAAQQRLYAALKSQGAIYADAQLASLTYVCSLSFEKRLWPVANVVEQVRGAEVARRQKRIVILDPALKVAKVLTYTDQTPLFCKGNQLFLDGNLGVDNTAPYGNVLTFYGAGGILASSVGINDLPIAPSRDRKTYLVR